MPITFAARAPPYLPREARAPPAGSGASSTTPCSPAAEPSGLRRARRRRRRRAPRPRTRARRRARRGGPRTGHRADRARVDGDAHDLPMRRRRERAPHPRPRVPASGITPGPEQLPRDRRGRRTAATTPAISCPCSCPLPAITTTSPGRGVRRARGRSRAGGRAPPCLAGPLEAREDLGDDRLGVLGARVVAGDVQDVGHGLGRRAHQRALGAVAVAAAPKTHMQPAAGEGACRGEHGVEPRGRVGVVDEHAEGLARLDGSKRPGGAATAAAPATIASSGTSTSSASATAQSTLSTLKRPRSSGLQRAGRRAACGHADRSPTARSSTLCAAHLSRSPTPLRSEARPSGVRPSRRRR